MQKRILKNIRIYPSLKEGSNNDAIYIENGFIKAIGPTDDLVSQFGNHTRIEDLDHSVLMPSFTDAHIHLLAYGISLEKINCENLNKRDCLTRIAEAVDNAEPKNWIIGHGWDHNLWEEGYGTKSDLDAISNQYPIYLTHKSLHCGWANSAALVKAGINTNTIDPEQGVIQRDLSGKPTGIVFEAAMQMIESAVPSPSGEEIKSALIKAQSNLNQFGISAVHDFDPWSVYEILNVMFKENTLSLRVTKGISESFLDDAIARGLISGCGNDWIKIGWLKLFADGALGPQTASMLAPYEDSKSSGMLFMSEDEIEYYGEKALPHGLALAVHAIGDRANRETLIALAHLHDRGLLQIPPLNSRIEHVQLISQEDIPLFAAHKITASMQPIHAISDLDMANMYWGDRCNHAYAWKSFLEAKTQLIFGSDAPVEIPNPFLGLYAAILRKKLGVKSTHDPGWIPDQRLDLKDALKAYTVNPSAAGGFGKLLGKVQVGYSADFVLLPKGFISIKPFDLQIIKPLATMIAGKWVYINDKINFEIN